MIKRFEQEYHKFTEWLQLHPDDYFINTGRTIESTYAVLHTAQCKHLKGYEDSNMPAGKQRSKICSVNIDSLYLWCLENRPKIPRGFSSLCKDCFPDQDIVWSSVSVLTPVASDVEVPMSPPRETIQTLRIVRDTRITRYVKLLYKNHCQLCGDTLHLADGRTYSEAHHIKPLGEGGPDVIENVICVCPNHHALLDYAAITLDLANFHSHHEHKIEPEYISYHNK